MSDTTYNGWKNYETWNWALWLDNEQGTYEMWRDNAREAYRNCGEGVSAYAKMTGKEIFSRSERAAQKLADMLKDDAEENQPELTGPYADILGAALSEIDWHEIATHYIDDISAEIDAEEADDADESDDEADDDE